MQVGKAGGEKWKSMTDAVRSPISLPKVLSNFKAIRKKARMAFDL